MSATAESRSSTSSPTRSGIPVPNSSYVRATPTPSPWQPPTRLTELSQRPYTATNAPTAIESQIQEAAHARPSSAYTTNDSNAYSRTNSFSGPLKPPEYFARPSSDASALLDLTPSAPTQQHYGRALEAVEQIPQSSNDRPETAMLYNRPDTAEACLPPRRELPFARSSVPRSAGSDSVRPSSRPSSMMGPPPLPARVASLRPPSSRATNPETELPPLPKPTMISTAQQQPSWMHELPRTPNQDNITPPSAQPNIFDDKENRPQSSSSQNSSPLSYKRASSTVLPSTRPLSSLGSADHSRRRSESHSPLLTPPTSDSQRQSRITGERSDALETSNADALAAYAMQSPEGRQAALNEFVFEQLENPNFLTLLEDMETCWARVGLPKK